MVAQEYICYLSSKNVLVIIDDIFTTDPTGHWLFLIDRNTWRIYSDYDWYYGRLLDRRTRPMVYNICLPFSGWRAAGTPITQ